MIAKVINRFHWNFKLDVMIGPTSRKNWLTFGDDPFRNTDSGFHFPHHGGIGEECISMSHTVTGRFSRHSAKWLTPTKCTCRSGLSDLLSAAKGVYTTFQSWSLFVHYFGFVFRIFRTSDLHYVLAAIRQTSGFESGSIRKSEFESWITFGWGWTPWRRFALSEQSSFGEYCLMMTFLDHSVEQ